MQEKPIQEVKMSQKNVPLCFQSTFVEVSLEEVKVSCNTNNVGYRWVCVTCQENNTVKVYEGELARSVRVRGAEHLKQLQGKLENSVLYIHTITFHRNENAKFKMEITGQFKDALTRQANEMVRISSHSCIEILNSKSEFNRPPIDRVMVDRNKKLEI